MNNIKITGHDIIGWSGVDETGALKELGVDFVPFGRGYDPAIAEREFLVDLDFVIRHNLMSGEIYKNCYKLTEDYRGYYNWGRASFLAAKTPHGENPFGEDIERRVRCYPWYDGYREAADAYFDGKYRITQLKEGIRALIKEHGLIVEFEDNNPYIKTPEGYISKLV